MNEGRTFEGARHELTGYDREMNTQTHQKYSPELFQFRA